MKRSPIYLLTVLFFSLLLSCSKDQHQPNGIKSDQFDPLTYNFVNQDSASVAARKIINDRIANKNSDSKARIFYGYGGFVDYILTPSGYIYNMGVSKGGASYISNYMDATTYFTIEGNLILSNISLSGATLISSGDNYFTIEVPAGMFAQFGYNAAYNPGQTEGYLTLKLTSPSNVSVNYTDDVIYFVN